MSHTIEEIREDDEDVVDGRAYRALDDMYKRLEAERDRLAAQLETMREERDGFRTASVGLAARLEAVLEALRERGCEWGVPCERRIPMRHEAGMEDEICRTCALLEADTQLDAHALRHGVRQENCPQCTTPCETCGGSKRIADEAGGKWKDYRDCPSCVEPKE